MILRESHSTQSLWPIEARGEWVLTKPDPPRRADGTNVLPSPPERPVHCESTGVGAGLEKRWSLRRDGCGFVSPSECRFVLGQKLQVDDSESDAQVVSGRTVLDWQSSARAARTRPPRSGPPKVEPENASIGQVRLLNSFCMSTPGSLLWCAYARVLGRMCVHVVARICVCVCIYLCICVCVCESVSTVAFLAQARAAQSPDDSISPVAPIPLPALPCSAPRPSSWPRVRDRHDGRAGGASPTVAPTSAAETAVAMNATTTEMMTVPMSEMMGNFTTKASALADNAPQAAAAAPMVVAIGAALLVATWFERRRQLH